MSTTENRSRKIQETITILATTNMLPRVHATGTELYLTEMQSHELSYYDPSTDNATTNVDSITLLPTTIPNMVVTNDICPSVTRTTEGKEKCAYFALA